MKNFSKNISPDSLTGSIFAIEGIKDACVILNGPTGCKFYHSAISDNQFIRSVSFDATQYNEEFFFGQPRVPCTYLDRDDYVYGSGEKLEKILENISKQKYKFIAIINSPGAALIGDDLNGFLRRKIKDIPYLSMESTGYSTTYGTGFENTIIKVIDSLDYSQEKLKGMNVNLLGMNIYQKHYDMNYEVIRKVLEFYNINVISAMGAGDSVEDLKNINKADLNIVVFPEYGLRTAEKLKEKFKTPFIVPKEGPPIGFYSTDSFIKEVCDFFKLEDNIGITEMEKARGRAYLYIARFSSLTGLPKGSSFSIKGEASIVYTITKWLSSYLGMVPVAIEFLEDSDAEFKDKLHEYLNEVNSLYALESEIINTDTDILLADGNTIAQLKLEGKTFSAIEINLPSLGYIDVSAKTIFGYEGSLFILEQILNGLRYL